MRSLFSRNEPESTKKRDWLGIVLKGRVLPILGITLVVLITVGIFLYRDQIRELGALSYPGVFLVSMVWNSTVLVPIPSFWTYFFLGQIFNPALVGLAGGSGAAVGELTSYLAGYSGRVMLRGHRRLKLYTRLEDWIKNRKRAFAVIFAFNLVPFFPFDLVGIAAGATRFPLGRFYLACLAGRTLSYGFIAWIGSRGWIPPLPFLNPP
ncbi:MAG: VTT domain-containing protein [Dehalococcoidales bacterium]|nr:VTT domain-containing protein [Dehalococcoidales bacterium]